MGCGVSRSDEGLVVVRSPHHNKPNLIEDTSNLHQPPVVQKIDPAESAHHHDSNDDQLWVGSPSFREYVQSSPEDGDVANSGVERRHISIVAHRYHATIMKFQN